MYSVYYLENNEWILLLSGLSKEGAEGHAQLYSFLFKAETIIKSEV